MDYIISLINLFAAHPPQVDIADLEDVVSAL